MGDGFLFDKLEVLNNVYNNTLLHTKPIPQAAIIKTKLLPHQAVLVNGMHVYRDKMTHGFVSGNRAINGKIGVLGDPAGSGKTLSVLAYLASQIATFPRMSCELTNSSSKYFFSHDLYQLSDISATNLIIVPHNLFSHWKQEIVKHTTIPHILIETKRALKNTELAQNIINSTFVLTTNTCFKHLQEFADQNNIEWNNIFIDEASSIYINSSDPPLKFQFLWFITNNWIPLLFRNPSLIKSNLLGLRNRLHIHPELNDWLIDKAAPHYDGHLVSSAYFKDYLPFFHHNRGNIIIRNLQSTINSSFNLPPILSETFNCRPNISLNSLIGFYLSRGLEPNIEPSKVINLFQALCIEFSDVSEYIIRQPSVKHNLISNKMNDAECIICFEPVDNPTIVNCCYNIYCAKCLIKNMLISQKCPTCREVLETNNLCCLTQLSQSEKLMAKNKAELCLDIFNANKAGKFIVYSTFDNIYYQLFEEIDKLGMKAERIENNLFSQLKTIKNFQDGKTHIMFISNIDLIRGISLPLTTHLIFYHELLSYEQRQVLIHSAQRIGRKETLKVIHLNSEIQI